MLRNRGVITGEGLEHYWHVYEAGESVLPIVQPEEIVEGLVEHDAAKMLLAAWDEIRAARMALRGMSQEMSDAGLRHGPAALVVPFGNCGAVAYANIEQAPRGRIAAYGTGFSHLLERINPDLPEEGLPLRLRKELRPYALDTDLHRRAKEAALSNGCRTVARPNIAEFGGHVVGIFYNARVRPVA